MLTVLRYALFWTFPDKGRLATCPYGPRRAISLGGLGSMQYLCVDPAVTFSNTAANAGWLAGVRGASTTE
jgi:hypothetical protein